MKNIEEAPLEGRVAEVRSYSSGSGFAVLVVEPLEAGRKKVVVAGRLGGRPEPGKSYRFLGSMREHAIYGRQFVASAALPLDGVPSSGISAETAIRWLEEHIRGIGRRTAEKLVEDNGPDCVRHILSGELDRLRLPGRWREIVEQGRPADTVRAGLMLHLLNAGLGSRWLEDIYRALGPEAHRLILQNPFLLMKVKGIGFSRAEKVAAALGHGPGTPVRRLGALCAAVEEAARAGNVCMEWNQAAARAAALSGCGPEAFDTVLDEVPGAREILVRDRAEIRGAKLDFVYPARLHEIERRTAELLRPMLDAEAPWGLGPKVVSAAVENLRLDVALTRGQKEAAMLPFLWRVGVLTGLPGTGKTTAMRAVRGLAERFGLSLHVAAPTGRAAVRISEVMGCPASTIHRLLGRRSRDSGRLPDGVYVIDEMSMVDLTLFWRLLEAFPETGSVLFVGDPNQLPSVGAGNVLNDLASCCRHRVHLAEVFRQSLQSGVTRAAHQVLSGKPPETSRSRSVAARFSDCHLVEARQVAGANGKPTADPESVLALLEELLQDTVPRQWKLDPVEHVQVLSPQRRGPVGTDELNRRLQQLLNPDRKGPSVELASGRAWRGDKVMVTSNSYRHGIFNGEVAVVRWIDPDNGSVLIDFGDREVQLSREEASMLELAYAATIHKSQGCEYPVVVIVAHKSHYKMLTRNLLYTAITRARQRVVFVGDATALWMAARNSEQAARMSLLVWRVSSGGTAA